MNIDIRVVCVLMGGTDDMLCFVFVSISEISRKSINEI